MPAQPRRAAPARPATTIAERDHHGEGPWAARSCRRTVAEDRAGSGLDARPAAVADQSSMPRVSRMNGTKPTTKPPRASARTGPTARRDRLPSMRLHEATARLSSVFVARYRHFARLPVRDPQVVEPGGHEHRRVVLGLDVVVRRIRLEQLVELEPSRVAPRPTRSPSGGDSSRIVVTTSTKGTCATTAANRSGRWFTTAPMSKPPALPPRPPSGPAPSSPPQPGARRRR